MNLGLQELLVSLFLLVPGFITTEIQRSFYPKRYEKELQWIVSSLLLGIFYNLIITVLFVMFGQFNADIKLIELSKSINDMQLGMTAIYIISLYALAIVWGVATGFRNHFGLRLILNKLGISSYAESPSVWDRIFEVRKTKDRPITWLKLNFEKKDIIGHLCHSSEHIDKEEPFEVYLDSIHILEGSRWTELKLPSIGLSPDGIYLRLLPEMIVEIFFTERSWSPINYKIKDSLNG